jgi:hypothetical protein
MKKMYFVIISLCILAAAVMPVQAFTAKSLTITLAGDGDARVDMRYDLSFLEQTAVFLKVADPAAELKKAFDSHSSEPVTVPQVTSSSAVVLIPGFATVNEGTRQARMITPSVSFEKAQQVMNSYWFAPLVSPDFSPDVTTVIFPDGHEEQFHDIITVPSLSHTLSR